MQFIILAALLATLAHGEVMPASAALDPAQSASGNSTWQLLFVVLTMLAAPIASACDAGWFVAGLRKKDLGCTANWHHAGERYERLQLAALWLWLAGSLAVVYVWQWPTLVQTVWSLRDWPVIDDAVILLPLLASLLLVWMTFYYVERSAQRLRVSNRPQTSLVAYLVWNVRHYLAMAIVPAFVVLAGQELLARYAVANFAWLMAIPAIVLLPVGLPMLLRRLWPTFELPAGELRDRLVAITRECQTPVSRILVWQTQRRMTNAAVAGLSRWCRYLFLTDALIEQLTPDEIGAVARHELGHLRRRHLLQRLLVLALPMLAGLLVQRALDLDSAWLSRATPYSLAVTAGFLVYAVVVVGGLSRWLEFDADLSVFWNETGDANADRARDLIYALAVLQGPQRENRFAHLLHPPTMSRITWIRRVLVKPAEGQAYRQRMDRLARAIYAVTIGLLICLALLAFR